jgi:hypothetical protein
MFIVAQGISKFLFFLILYINSMYASVPNSLIGKWKGEDKPNNHTEFFVAKDGFYYGKLIYEGSETKNLGKILFKKLSYNSTTKEFKGTMSPPDSNAELNMTISFLGNDKLKVVAKKLLMTKTIYLLRIK